MSVGVGSEKKNVYDRIFGMVSANKQRAGIKVLLLPRFADANSLPTSSSMK